MHASTFGGNPIACRAGLATIETIEDDALLPRAGEIGCRFHKHFDDLKADRPDLVAAIRIQGVMIGLELTTDATPAVAACLQRRLLINVTHGNVIRLLPALNITDAEIDQGAAILLDVLRDFPRAH
jgi:acetylornithine/succinyldiaminopimelate/putrescine aminotransferase